MAAVVSQVFETYQDGLGQASQLGVCFLRRVTVTGNGATSVTLTNTNFGGGCQRIVRIVSIVPQAQDTVWVSTPLVELQGTSVGLSWTNGATVFDVFALCAGM